VRPEQKLPGVFVRRPLFGAPRRRHGRLCKTGKANGMNDDAGAAPAASPRGGVSQTQPDSDAGQTSSAIERTQETARASVDRAFASLNEQEAEERAGTDSTHDAGRDEHDKPSAGLEVPARFSADAKEAWASVPDSIKGETNRALRELSDGLGQYQEIFEPLKPFYQLARKFGTTVHDTLDRYVNLDFALLSNQPEERLQAIERVLQHAGIAPRDYAAYVMGQRSDEAQSRDDQTVRELRREITDLRNQLGGVYQSVQQRHEDEALKQVEAFAEQNPRLNEPEFQEIVIRLLTAGMARDLKGAHDMAARLSPEAVKDIRTATASNAANPRPAAQTRNGNLSITGGPGSGSNPARRKAPSTARESIDSAFASLGING
jgi:hypothetical protein